MSGVEYHIEELHADLNPNPGRTERLTVRVELEMGEAEWFPNDDALQADATIELELRDRQEYEEEAEPQYGTITIETLLYFPVDNEAFPDINVEEVVERWNEEGYEHIDDSVIGALEREFIPKMFAPLDQLLSDSFRDILPRLRFTRSPEEAEEDEETDDN